MFQWLKCSPEIQQTCIKTIWKNFYNFFYPNCFTQNLNWILYILTKSNAFITHSSGRYPNSNGNKLYILTLLWMPLTIWADKKLWRFFPLFFLHACYFLDEYFNICKFKKSIKSIWDCLIRINLLDVISGLHHGQS